MRASPAPGTPARARWLLGEIGDFLAADAPPEEREPVARAALRNGHEDFRQFAESRCAADEVVAVGLVVERDGQVVNASTYRRLPSPIGLLMVCSTVCVDGDVVFLVQSLACTCKVTTSEQWPFGVEAAEQMTIPATVRVAALSPGSVGHSGAGHSRVDDGGVSRGSVVRGSAHHRSDE